APPSERHACVHGPLTGRGAFASRRRASPLRRSQGRRVLLPPRRQRRPLARGGLVIPVAGNRIANKVRRALIAAAKTRPVAVAIDATGCSVHAQQEVTCAGNFVVWCPACWPNARDGGNDAAPKATDQARDAGKDR